MLPSGVRWNVEFARSAPDGPGTGEWRVEEADDLGDGNGGVAVTRV